MKKIKIIKKLIQKPKLILYILDRINFIRIRDSLYLKLSFEYNMNKKLNLENPETFNEKLNWLKLYNRKEEYTNLVDKYEVKKYIANTIGEQYIIPTLGIWEKFDDIDFDRLPNQFVLKCTHDSGSTIICKDKNKFDKKTAKKKIEKALKKNFYYICREWPYKNVKPRIIAEKYMVDESREELKDYKIFNFNGECKVIEVDYNRFENHKRNFYTPNWDYIDLRILYPNDPTHIIEKPKKLNLMLELANKLSQNIPFVRTDFYSIDDKIYFGELTFYHEAGYGKFYPEEYDKIFGKWINLENIIKEKNGETTNKKSYKKSDSLGG